jgi:PAS domain S-box-containing protein
MGKMLYLGMAISDRFDRVSEKIEMLLQREEAYETFLNASPWGILVVDKTFHIVYANKKLEVMSGYTLNELIGKHLHILMPKEDVPAHIKHEKAYVKNPHSRTGNHGLEPRLRHKNGTVDMIEISISPTEVHGERYFFASIRLMETLYDSVYDTLR